MKRLHEESHVQGLRLVSELPRTSVLAPSPSMGTHLPSAKCPAPSAGVKVVKAPLPTEFPGSEWAQGGPGPGPGVQTTHRVLGLVSRQCLPASRYRAGGTRRSQPPAGEPLLVQTPTIGFSVTPVSPPKQQSSSNGWRKFLLLRFCRMIIITT